MKKQVIYKYLGTNGVIETPVHLEDIYYTRLIELTADEGYILTDGNRKCYSVRVPEDNVEFWTEVIDDQVDQDKFYI